MQVNKETFCYIKKNEHAACNYVQRMYILKSYMTLVVYNPPQANIQNI